MVAQQFIPYDADNNPIVLYCKQILSRRLKVTLWNQLLESSCRRTVALQRIVIISLCFLVGKELYCEFIIVCVFLVTKWSQCQLNHGLTQVNSG